MGNVPPINLSGLQLRKEYHTATLACYLGMVFQSQLLILIGFSVHYRNLQSKFINYFRSARKLSLGGVPL